jgi:23S rRNA-intervening sequence protein
MVQQEMVIFTRTFDCLTWLMGMTNHFPRAHRQTLTKRLLDAAFDLRERLEEAQLRKGRNRLERLHGADEALARVRLYVRLAHKMCWMSDGQYFHVSGMLVEIGRLLGGWKKGMFP